MAEQSLRKDPAFPQFPRLPPELRRKIWLAVAQIPRTIEVSQNMLYSGKLRRLLDIRNVIRTKFTGHTTPALLSASVESRCAALEVYTPLKFWIYEANVEHYLTKTRSLYVNLNLDVLYLQNCPRHTQLNSVKNIFLTNYSPFRRIRFDTRLARGGFCDWWDDDGLHNPVPTEPAAMQAHRKMIVRGLFRQTWYYSLDVEVVEFVLEKDADENLSAVIVREALEDLIHGSSLAVGLEFFRVQALSRVDDPEIRMHWIFRADGFDSESESESVSESEYPAIRIQFPLETRKRMIALPQF